MTERSPASKKDEVLRYIALLASRITLGESDPGQVNWRYLRDQTMAALGESGSDPQPAAMAPPAGLVRHRQY